jgi:hypothetical protein
MKTKKSFALLFISLFVITNCSKDKSEGEQKISCGNGSGYTVEFCDQVGYYEAGYGEPGLDEINATCLVGPKGATVSNQTNGTYYCSGTYKLTSFDEGEISIGWGGTTYFDSSPEDYHITKGEGTFSLKITKKSGGSGNIFLSMSSGSSWMFDVALINICNSKKSTVIKYFRTDNHNGFQENCMIKNIPYAYGLN